MKTHKLYVGVVLILVLATSGCSNNGSGSAPASSSAQSTNLSELPCFDRSVLTEMHSSYARAGTNLDFYVVADPAPHQRPYLYRDEQGRFVLLDVKGPGAITRIWMTQLAPDLQNPGISQGPLLDTGNIQIFFDNEEAPRIDLPAREFFKGETAPFLAPLCGDNTLSSGGNFCMVSMPFAERAIVAVSGRPNYWNIEYERFAANRPVQIFDPSDESLLQSNRAIKALYEGAGLDPHLLPSGKTHEGNADLEAGEKMRLVQLAGASVIKSLEVILEGEAELREIWLEASWDGQNKVQINAPLSDLFMSGRGEKNNALGLLAGFEVDKRRGYLFFPMPFRRSADISLINRSENNASIRWSVVESSDTRLAQREECGLLHAEYQAPMDTVTGEDYVLADLENVTGKVVGLSLNVEGPVYNTLTTFLEGDERIYIDGSQTPQIYGTGMEDIFNGGFYYQNGPFSLPTHGLSAAEETELGFAVAQYRQMLSDSWVFRDSIRIGVEHGGGNGVPTINSSLVFWYGEEESSLVLSDSIDVGDPDSERDHGYVSGSLIALELQGYYSGDRDGNISSELFDMVIFPGALPSLDPEELVTDEGRYHAVGDIINMQFSIDPGNRGLLLRRRLDTILFDQTAMVYIDGEPVGIWNWPIVNDLKRWADHEMVIPAEYTNGKSQIEITLEVLPPIQTPLISGLSLEEILTTQVSLPSIGILNLGGWSDFRYEVYSMY